jgi:hypothetical protein
MPIIPSNWTGLDTVNAIGGSGGLTGYAYAKQLTTTITELDTFIDLIGVCNEPISREVSLDLITGRLKLYWKNLDGTYTQLHRDNLIFNTGYKVVDLTLGQLGLSIKCSEVTELFLVVRWDKDIAFNLYSGEDLMIPVKVRLCLGTGANYVQRNVSDFDEDSDQYLTNLAQLKNSDSGATGYKLFDIFTFYPGKPIIFDVLVNSPTSYGGIALQLFDPISVGEAVFDVANDVLNFELNELSNTFVGNVTKNALYQGVSNNKVEVRPDFSRHAGRFVAQNIHKNNAFDTAIIKSYTPNTNPLLGGTFTLTGKF